MLKRAVRALALVVALGVLGTVGFAGVEYYRLTTGLHRSHVLADQASANPGASPTASRDINLLVMGLDTRLDEDGKPLPPALYAALHAGTADDGGENSNVLILVHIPGDGSRASAISIPRDDYVALPGCPDRQCMGKIKQAYGLAYDQKANELANRGAKLTPDRVQQQRDAGRTAEIAAVQQFLGNNLHVDHFVEVTLAAFYEFAQVVQPVTVCLNEDTQDSFSGANFHAGQQQLDAMKAVAFVRQRRDNTHPTLNFTDLDRERRQQAFIASLAVKLKSAGTLTDPTKINNLIGVARSNFAIDDGLSLPQLAGLADRLSGGNITFYTLPVASFGTTPGGEAINVVDIPQIQATVATLLIPAGSASQPGGGSAGPATAPAATPVPSAGVEPSAAPGATAPITIANASGIPGLAGRVAARLRQDGYHRINLINSPTTDSSTIRYAAHSSTSTTDTDADTAAETARSLSATLSLGITAPDPAIPAGGVLLTLGRNDGPDLGLAPGAGATAESPSKAASGGSPTASALPLTAVQGTGSGTDAPPVTALTALQGGGVPCVK